MDENLYNKCAELVFKKYFIGKECWDIDNRDRRIMFVDRVKKLYFQLYNEKELIKGGMRE